MVKLRVLVCRYKDTAAWEDASRGLALPEGEILTGECNRLAIVRALILCGVDRIVDVSVQNADLTHLEQIIDEQTKDDKVPQDARRQQHEDKLKKLEDELKKLKSAEDVNEWGDVDGKRCQIRELLAGEIQDLKAEKAALEESVAGKVGRWFGCQAQIQQIQADVEQCTISEEKIRTRYMSELAAEETKLKSELEVLNANEVGVEQTTNHKRTELESQCNQISKELEENARLVTNSEHYKTSADAGEAVLMSCKQVWQKTLKERFDLMKERLKKRKTCKDCKGTVPEFKKCTECNGSGKDRLREEISVRYRQQNGKIKSLRLQCSNDDAGLWVCCCCVMNHLSLNYSCSHLFAILLSDHWFVCFAAQSIHC